MFIPIGEDSQFDYFSDGLVQPPTRTPTFHHEISVRQLPRYLENFLQKQGSVKLRSDQMRDEATSLVFWPLTAVLLS